MATLLPTAVFDCNIYLQGLLSRTGPARACVDLLFTEQITVFTSNKIIEELADVLNRTSLVRKFSRRITDEFRTAYIEQIISKTTVRSARHVFDLPRDPNDEPYLDLFIERAAEYLVTRDNDLLDLQSEEDSENASMLKHQAQGTIVSPPQFLNCIRDTRGPNQ